MSSLSLRSVVSSEELDQEGWGGEPGRTGRDRGDESGLVGEGRAKGEGTHRACMVGRQKQRPEEEEVGSGGQSQGP